MEAIEAKVLKCKDYLEADLDDSKLLYVLKKLSQLDVDIDILQNTGIGKIVNSFRKREGPVGQKSLEIVKRWKALAAAEAERLRREEQEAHQSESENSANENNGSEIGAEHSANENVGSESEAEHSVNEKGGSESEAEQSDNKSEIYKHYDRNESDDAKINHEDSDLVSSDKASNKHRYEEHRFDKHHRKEKSDQYRYKAHDNHRKQGESKSHSHRHSSDSNRAAKEQINVEHSRKEKNYHKKAEKDIKSICLNTEDDSKNERHDYKKRKHEGSKREIVYEQKSDSKHNTHDSKHSKHGGIVKDSRQSESISKYKEHESGSTSKSSSKLSERSHERHKHSKDKTEVSSESKEHHKRTSEKHKDSRNIKKSREIGYLSDSDSDGSSYKSRDTVNKAATQSDMKHYRDENTEKSSKDKHRSSNKVSVEYNKNFDQTDNKFSTSSTDKRFKEHKNHSSKSTDSVLKNDLKEKDERKDKIHDKDTRQFVEHVKKRNNYHTLSDSDSQDENMEEVSKVSSAHKNRQSRGTDHSSSHRHKDSNRDRSRSAERESSTEGDQTSVHRERHHSDNRVKCINSTDKQGKHKHYIEKDANRDMHVDSDDNSMQGEHGKNSRSAEYIKISRSDRKHSSSGKEKHVTHSESRDKHKTRDSKSREKHKTGDTESREKLTTRDSENKDKHETRGSESRDKDKHKIGNHESRDMHKTGNSETRDKHTTRDSESKDKHKIGVSESRDKHKPRDIESRDKHKTGDIESRDKHNRGDSKSRDNHKTRDSESRDKHKTGDSESRDKRKTSDNESRDRHETGDNESGDKHKTRDGESRDKHKTWDSESRDRHKTGDNKSRDGERRDKNRTKDSETRENKKPYSDKHKDVYSQRSKDKQNYNHISEKELGKNKHKDVNLERHSQCEMEISKSQTNDKSQSKSDKHKYGDKDSHKSNKASIDVSEPKSKKHRHSKTEELVPKKRPKVDHTETHTEFEDMLVFNDSDAVVTQAVSIVKKGIDKYEQLKAKFKVKKKFESKTEGLGGVIEGVKRKAGDNGNAPAAKRQMSEDLASYLPSTQAHYRPWRYGEPSGKHTATESSCTLFHKATTRTAVYSGKRQTGLKEMHSLFDLCIKVLQENISYIDYVGGIPFYILKPVLERCNTKQLYDLEDYNPHFLEDSDCLWKSHCEKDFRGSKPEEMETWRELYLRKMDERDAKLKSVRENITKHMAKAEPVRGTKIAFIDNVAKPPREVRRQQARFGTSNTMSHPKMSKNQFPAVDMIAVGRARDQMLNRASKPALLKKSLNMMKSMPRR